MVNLVSFKLYYIYSYFLAFIIIDPPYGVTNQSWDKVHWEARDLQNVLNSIEAQNAFDPHVVICFCGVSQISSFMVNFFLKLIMHSYFF